LLLEVVMLPLSALLMLMLMLLLLLLLPPVPLLPASTTAGLTPTTPALPSPLLLRCRGGVVLLLGRTPGGSTLNTTSSTLDLPRSLSTVRVQV
jgi:hypothetical protein